MPDIKSLWETIPKGTRMKPEYLLTLIPHPPNCIEYNKLVNFLGIQKNTLTYHLKNLEKDKLIIKLRVGKVLYLTRYQEEEKNGTE